MVQKKFALHWVIEITLIALLTLVASYITRHYLGDSLFAWGDHPGGAGADPRRVIGHHEFGRERYVDGHDDRQHRLDRYDR